MEVECTFSAPIYRYESDDFIRHLDLSVVDHTSEGERLILGKIAGDLLPLTNVVNARESLYDVCDADSAGWEEVYQVLFEKGDEFRPELGIDPGIDNLIFIWKTLLHPKLNSYRQGLMETIGTMFGGDTIVAMWRAATEMSDKELAELGFKKVAGCDLVYRDMTYVSEYTKNHPNGTEEDSEFAPTKEDEMWIKERWDDEKWGDVDFQWEGEPS